MDKVNKMRVGNEIRQKRVMSDLYAKENKYAYVRLMNQKVLPPIASNQEPEPFKTPPAKIGGLKQSARPKQKCPFSRLDRVESISPYTSEAMRYGELLPISQTTLEGWQSDSLSEDHFIPTNPKYAQTNTLLGEDILTKTPPPQGRKHVAGPATTVQLGNPLWA